MMHQFGNRTKQQRLWSHLPWLDITVTGDLSLQLAVQVIIEILYFWLNRELDMAISTPTPWDCSKPI